MKFFLFKEFLKINSLLNQKIKFKLFISVIVYFLCNQNSSAEVKKIQHPFAEKGLTKIEADGTYVYKVDLLEKRKLEFCGSEQWMLLKLYQMMAKQVFLRCMAKAHIPYFCMIMNGNH